jgi:hypothetical protein
MYAQLPDVNKALHLICKHIPHDCICIHGKLYHEAQIDTFKHPGGQLFIEISKGTDATALFETHHINYNKALNALSSLSVATDTESEKFDIFYDFSSYREFRHHAFQLFKTDTSRRMNLLTTLTLWFTISITAIMHYVTVTETVGSLRWVLSCFCSAFLNTVCGGYGHNAVHVLHFTSVLLDWNGLSAYEWLHEHVHSHHMYTNTAFDHDALSMMPLLHWIPENDSSHITTGLLPHWGKHLIFSIAEIAVAFNGLFIHRTRWKLGNKKIPLWLQLAPCLFVVRLGSYFFQKNGFVTFLLTMGLAGYYFSYLAHLSHVYGGNYMPNFLIHQLQNTKDIPTPLFPAMVMFLDRQTLHHLLPTIDHTRLTLEVRRKLSSLNIPALKSNLFTHYSYSSLNNKQNDILKGVYSVKL